MAGIKEAEEQINVAILSLKEILSQNDINDIEKVKNYIAGQLGLIPANSLVALGQFQELQSLYDQVMEITLLKMFSHEGTFQLPSSQLDEIGQPRMLTFNPAMVFCKKYQTKGTSVGHVALFLLEQYILINKQK